MEHYDITVAGVKRSLPVVPISDTLSIASFVIFGDTDVVEPCARELAAKLPPVDYLITAEAKSIPLIYEMAKVMKMPRYLIARKSVKGYMKNPIVTKVNSITTTREQILCLDEDDINLIKGSRMAIVDDVISTGRPPGSPGWSWPGAPWPPAPPFWRKGTPPTGRISSTWAPSPSL